MKFSIVIVDDHVLIAKALRSIISNFPKFEVLYECENGKELQQKLTNKKNIPNIILLDISMPVMDGFETAVWLKLHHPDVRIITLSMDNGSDSVIKMIRSGSKGYLLKNTHPVELERALISVMEKGSYYPEWAVNSLFSGLDEQLHGKIEISLSEREKEFLQYTITEMSYKEISQKMFCSPRTVESYRDSLFEKLGMKTRVGLAVYAIKNGLAS
ncbi:response regulator transcription factor [Flavobacterium pallidum]|uniref:DNA-binding response regulator n=1 Tax=Flavobacterium pallidum TaxID=2172098 RepID=A0A2S1SHJ4_9FLAO|nr:response regulator transcription factor [Flavobacterium pallidum]AWI25884.1 DNA-binding response regulator [Flavobacterium pallidum]